MSRDYRLYLQDIIECCENVRQYTAGQTFEEFSVDKKTIDAVVRNLEIIGGAVKNIPSELLQMQPEIEWKQIARFRDNVIHRYFGVRLPIVWDVLQNRIAELDKAVGEILAHYPETEN